MFYSHSHDYLFLKAFFKFWGPTPQDYNSCFLLYAWYASCAAFQPYLHAKEIKVKLPRWCSNTSLSLLQYNSVPHPQINTCGCYALFFCSKVEIMIFMRRDWDLWWKASEMPNMEYKVDHSQRFKQWFECKLCRFAFSYAYASPHLYLSG